MTVTVDVSSAFQGLVKVAVVVIVAGVAWLFVGSVRRFIVSRRFERTDRQAMRERWSEIERLVRDRGEVSRKLAVIEADKLLDSALRSLALPGETLGERLKFAAYRYPKVREVWWAHKIRNQLVHESSYHLDEGLARKAVHQFKKTLITLGAL